ncbi:hypothetical protein PALB_1010 [Pseudoalteromonas luteoviolacea B = ATCC 29581]|nr:hypothetical protein PALB_1010 [Pseudoalteromonas luteoviolacea B = ATCC 29581]
MQFYSYSQALAAAWMPHFFFLCHVSLFLYFIHCFQSFFLLFFDLPLSFFVTHKEH